MDTPTHVHDTPRPSTEPANSAARASTSMTDITMNSFTASTMPSMSTTTTTTTTTRPTLLPAFEPFSSSPALPRPAKRKFAETLDEEELAAAAAASAAARRSYPTPIPTSSTGILPSSPPPQQQPPARRTRPGLQRTVSTLSERVPLNDVPSLELPSSGEPLLMGRSSNSSDYQLSSHRNISRVHVRARYLPPTTPAHPPRGTLEVECLGWNGVKVQTRRGTTKVVELAKGEKYLEEIFDQPVVLDVQDTRVMLVWPKDLPRDGPAAGLSSAAMAAGRSAGEEPGSPWSAESPSRSTLLMSHAPFGSSPPLLVPGRQISPVSPRRGLDFGATFTSTFRDADDDADDGLVQIYEDQPGEDDDADAPHDPTPVPGTPTPKPVLSNVASIKKQLQQSPLCTTAGAGAASDPEDLSEHDEENDPIVHSFYNTGDNLLSRFQSFQPSSPERRKRKPLHQAPSNSSPGRVQQRSFKAGGNGPASLSSPRKPTAAAAAVTRPNWSPVRNHVINQLAFSRIHSLPLSTIHSNLPAELRAAAAAATTSSPALTSADDLSPADLQNLLLDIPCVGEIRREGKDAAGKLLESEFYYVPEMDPDVNRRETVTMSLGKTSIRAARKSHKVCLFSHPPRPALLL